MWLSRDYCKRKNCIYIDDCNDKRMEMVGCLELNALKVSADEINNEFDFEELKKQMKEQLHENVGLGIQFGA